MENCALSTFFPFFKAAAYNRRDAICRPSCASSGFCRRRWKRRERIIVLLLLVTRAPLLNSLFSSRILPEIERENGCRFFYPERGKRGRRKKTIPHTREREREETGSKARNAKFRIEYHRRSRRGYERKGNDRLRGISSGRNLANSWGFNLLSEMKIPRSNPIFPPLFETDKHLLSSLVVL